MKYTLYNMSKDHFLGLGKSSEVSFIPFAQSSLVKYTLYNMRKGHLQYLSWVFISEVHLIQHEKGSFCTV